MPDQAQPDAFPWDVTLKHTFELWINPEIERRRTEGRLPPDFSVHAAQVIMKLGTPPVVRLNDEVKLIVKVPQRAEPFKVGDAIPINWDEVAEISLGPDDADASHTTIIRDGNRWLLTFDFRYNSEKANDYLDASRDFLETAREALRQNRLRPFAENLFGATELAVKAKLLTMPDEEVLKSKKHGLVAGKYNRWAKLGNTAPENARLLNQLGSMRSSARYLGGAFMLTAEEGEAMLAQAEKLLQEAMARVPPRRRRPA